MQDYSVHAHADPDQQSSPTVGVVTVTFNSEPFLAEFFDSCRHQTLLSHRIYCIDNASRDGTADVLKLRQDRQLAATLNTVNVGVAAGNNQGIVQALNDGCEWVLLLNNDTTFPASLFADLLRACVETNRKVVVPKIHFDQPRGTLWYAGGGFNRRRGHTGYHTGISEADNGQFDVPGTVEYAPTCCMLVHRSVFESVGLMDESYFVYYDDTDFCWRLRQAGIAIGYWPQATLVHKVGGSTGGGSSPFSARITARNRLYFLRKHRGAWAPLLWLPIFLTYYIGRYLIRNWNPACFMASVKGSFAYAKMKAYVPPLSTRSTR